MKMSKQMKIENAKIARVMKEMTPAQLKKAQKDNWNRMEKISNAYAKKIKPFEDRAFILEMAIQRLAYK